MKQGTQQLGFFDPQVVSVFEQGVQKHQSGDLDGAVASYEQVLAMSTDHPGALNLMGVVLHQRGEHEKAIPMLKRAIEIAPANADFYLNLGAVYYGMQDHELAEKYFRISVEMSPGNPESNGNLGTVLVEMGRKEEALGFFKAAFEASPGNGRFLKRLADVALDLGKFSEAADAFEKFIELFPNHAEALNNLGYVYERIGDMKKTAEYYKRALDNAPGAPEIANNLGSVLARLGRQEEAQEYFKIALEAPDDKWEDAANVAGTYLNTGDFERAISLFEIALKKDDSDARVWSDYGNALGAAGRLKEASKAMKRALELKPDYPEVWNNLGNISFRSQDLVDATEQFKKAIHYRPMYLEPYINVCLTLMYQRKVDEAYMYAHSAINLSDFHHVKFTNPHKVFRGVCDFDSIDELGDIWSVLEAYGNPDVSASFLEMLPLCDTPEHTARLVKLHKRWGEVLIRQYSNEEPLPPRPPRDPNKKLKVGFLSSDLRRHSVANFVLPIFKNYDKSKMEIHCFSPYLVPGDNVQERIMDLVDGFHDLSGISDREAALRVQEEGIDILLELNGFTRDTMIKILRFKPAPIQVYWLGYPFTTGLPEMDHILVDPYFCPADLETITEKPLKMPEAWVCFDHFRDEPISEQTPFDRNGFITFGSLNNTYKFTRECIAAWAGIMREVENSRFLLVRPEADSVILRNMLKKEFADNNVDPDRIEFFNNFNRSESHFSYYNLIDISLDTFPMTGGTTTCDAIWMGVPVISLVGPALHQRISYSLLENAGCGELACHSMDEYLGKAVMLANDPESLREYRHNMRPALLKSPLCDSERFARGFENAMTEAFEQHRNGGSSD